MKNFGKSTVSTKGKAMALEGVPELVKTVKALARTLSGEEQTAFVERLKQICMKPALVIRDEARDMAPVVTGKLRAGMFAAPHKTKVGAVVGVHDVFYAPFVEYGTSRNVANPFLRPSVTAARPTFANMMAGDLTKVIDEVSAAHAAHPSVNK